MLAAGVRRFSPSTDKPNDAITPRPDLPVFAQLHLGSSNFSWHRSTRNAHGDSDCGRRILRAEAVRYVFRPAKYSEIEVNLCD